MLSGQRLNPRESNTLETTWGIRDAWDGVRTCPANTDGKSPSNRALPGVTPASLTLCHRRRRAAAAAAVMEGVLPQLREFHALLVWFLLLLLGNTR